MSRMASCNPSHSDVPSQSTQIRKPRSDRRQMNLHAKRTSESSAISSGDKVKEMAAFLSVQLLEKVMAEAMKPEGESKMDLEVVERITKALQMSSQPSSDASATLPEETAMKDKETTATPETSASTPTDDKENETDDARDLIIEDDDSSSATETDMPEEPTMESEEEIPVAKKEETVAQVAESLQPSPSIPEIKVKPLEVIQSGIPALRPESIPQRQKNTEEVTVVTQSNDGSVVDESSSEESEKDEEECKTPEEVAEVQEASSSEEIDSVAAIAERSEATELFQRRLLQQKLEYDSARAVRIENEKDTGSKVGTEVDEKPSSDLEGACDEETEEKSKEALIEPETTNVSSAIESKEDTQDTDEEPTKGESNDVNTDISSELIEGKGEDVSPVTSVTTPSPPPTISDRRVETIVALRQPKSSDEESKLAEKYAQMESLEDRAYAVLCDLGMIEEHQNPNNPSYDHSRDQEYCEQRFLPRL